MRRVNGQVFFRTPDVFTPQNVKYFLKEISPLFSMEGKTIPNVVFDADGLTNAGLLGQLLIYKFMEYSLKKRCFFKPSFHIQKKIFNEFRETGFQKLVLAFARNKKAEYQDLKYEEEAGLFIAPINLANLEDGSDSQELYAPRIRDYYNDLMVSFIAILCMSEIASNFSAHAQDDTNSILVARGNQDFFEIACADNGKGIVSTLRPTLENSRLSPFEVLEKAMQRGVTSKRGTDHMGYGLWLVNEMVRALRGEMYVFSDRAYYINIQGKIKRGESSYWRGTIIYVRLSLLNREFVDDIYLRMEQRYNRIKIQRYSDGN